MVDANFMVSNFLISIISIFNEANLGLAYIKRANQH